MIRRTFWVPILLFVFSLFGVNSARAADPYGSAGGSMEQTQSPYQGAMGIREQRVLIRWLQVSSPLILSPLRCLLSPRGRAPPAKVLPRRWKRGLRRGCLHSRRNVSPPSSNWFPARWRSRKPSSTCIQKDPNIRFLNAMGVPPPGSILVPVKIVPDPEKKEFRPIQPMVQQTILPPDVDAGYLAGPPDRIGEDVPPPRDQPAPIRSRWTSSISGSICSSRGAPVSSRRTGCR